MNELVSLLPGNTYLLPSSVSLNSNLNNEIGHEFRFQEATESTKFGNRISYIVISIFVNKTAK